MALGDSIFDEYMGKARTGESPALLCREIMHEFSGEGGEFAWSSYMIDQALKVASLADAGPPESLVRAAWAAMTDRHLDESCYQFCRDFGRHLLASFRGDPRWDLGWMLNDCTPSQACLRYWTLGVKPELWRSEVETRTMKILASYPFEF